MVAYTPDEAEKGIDMISHLTEGSEIVVEDCLIGCEVSFLVVTDGMSAIPLISAKTINAPKTVTRDRIPEAWVRLSLLLRLIALCRR